MSHLRQVFSGALVALISISIVLGGLSLALLEGGIELAQRQPSAPPLLTNTPETVSAEPGVMISPTPQSPGTVTATPTLVEVDGCPPPADWVTIRVKRGDTLQALASAYGIDHDTLKQNNCLEIDDLLPGSVLFVPRIGVTPSPTPTESGLQAVCGPPAGWALYTVKPNDNLYRLGLEFGVSFEELQWANCLGNSRLIVTGSQIYVPPGPQTPVGETQEPTRTRTPFASPSTSPTTTATRLLATPTPTIQPSIQPSATLTHTPSRTPTAMASPTRTRTETHTPTSTSTPSPTSTPAAGTPVTSPSATLQLTIQVPE